MARTRYTVDMILEIYRRNKNGESLREVSKSLGLNGKKALENILYRLDRTMDNPQDRYGTDVMREVVRRIKNNLPSTVNPVSGNLARLEEAMNHLQDTIVDVIVQEVGARISKEKKEMKAMIEAAKKSNWLSKLSDRFSTELEQ